jgi:hypothetical protein
MESTGAVEDTRELDELENGLVPLIQCEVFGFFICYLKAKPTLLITAHLGHATRTRLAGSGRAYNSHTRRAQRHAGHALFDAGALTDLNGKKNRATRQTANTPDANARIT